METVNIHAAKTNLSKLIERVEKGESLIISRNGRPLANLSPYHASQLKLQPRRGGQWTGKIRYAADWDKTDADLQKLFEDSEIFPKDAPKES